jgi:hypothetical protein
LIAGMRFPLLSSILLAATVGGCNQALTGNMTGTGGSGTGGFGTGGFGTGGIVGTGGLGGDIGTGGLGGSVCNTLLAEYQSALSAAETCEVGASGQCQQLVTNSLSACTCQSYVTDSSALNTIQGAWQAAGCDTGPVPPCNFLCPAALNTTCVSVDGGSLGYCSYAPGTGGVSGAGGDGATGGTTGAGGSTADGGTETCATLASEYAAVLVGAQSCTANAAGQCAESVPAALSACPPCPTYVNDSTVLGILQQRWNSLGCGNVAIPCPRIACPAPAGAACLPSDAGGSVCSPVYPLLLGG